MVMIVDVVEVDSGMVCVKVFFGVEVISVWLLWLIECLSVIVVWVLLLVGE